MFAYGEIFGILNPRTFLTRVEKPGLKGGVLKGESRSVVTCD